MTTEAMLRGPGHSWACLEPQQPEEQEGASPSASGGSSALPTPGFETSGLQVRGGPVPAVVSRSPGISTAVKGVGVGGGSLQGEI